MPKTAVILWEDPAILHSLRSKITTKTEHVLFQNYKCSHVPGDNEVLILGTTVTMLGYWQVVKAKALYPSLKYIVVDRAGWSNGIFDSWVKGFKEYADLVIIDPKSDKDVALLLGDLNA